jgi:pyrroline-5-carboxylate reductase
MSRLAEVAMDLFVELFGSMLAFVYHCFDRIVIHGYLSSLSRPDQVVYFFRQVVGVPVVLCQEDAQASCCARDGGRPSGAALQEEASNCHELLRSKAAVVNVMVKRRGCDRVMYGSGRRAQANLR